MGLAQKRWSALVDYAAPSEIAHGIDARVLPEPSSSIAPDLLVFQYVLRADMARVRVPQPETPGRAEGLWKHTCFEAFISASGSSGYYELNFSPSGQWAIYSFDRYRTGMSAVEVSTPPRLAVRAHDDRLELEAVVYLFDLGLGREGLELKLALTAVVEDDSGSLSYWALKHAPGKPDFHHSDGFVLELTL
jgi:hypothetical protein